MRGRANCSRAVTYAAIPSSGIELDTDYEAWRDKMLEVGWTLIAATDDDAPNP
jgi:hypothetical protein